MGFLWHTYQPLLPPEVKLLSDNKHKGEHHIDVRLLFFCFIAG